MLNVKPGGIYSDHWAFNLKPDVSLPNTQQPNIGAYPQPNKLSLTSSHPTVTHSVFSCLLSVHSDISPTVAASDEVSTDAIF